MPALSAGDLTLLRGERHRFKEYLAVMQPAVVLACQLNGAPTGDPVTQITYDNVTQGAFGNVVAGMTLWVGTSAGGRQKGTCRIRKAATANTLYVAEDSAIDWTDDDHLTVVLNYEFWIKYPRIIVNEDITFYKDWEVAYSDQHSKWAPVAILGPPDCQFINPGTGLATCKFVGEHSYAVAPGASLSSYSWVFPGGTPGTANTAGTDAAPHSVTWDTPGIYWVTLTVTDSNGKTHTGRRPVFIFNRTGESVPYTHFKMTGRSGDLNQHGHTASFEIYGDADQSEFPDGAMVVYWTEDWYGDTQQSIGGNFKYRSHIKFVGYIQKESTVKDPQTSLVTFEAATVNALMDTREGFSAWIKTESSASDWCQATNLTADRAALSLTRYNSTLLDIADVMISGDSLYIKSQEFAAKSSLLQQLQTLYDDLFAHVACDKQGRVYFEIDPQMRPVDDRGTISIVADLQHGDWRDRLDLPRPQESQTSFINLSGVYYPGYPNEVEPILSKAPGDAPAYQGSTTEIPGLILGGQSDGNTKAGLALARDNNQFPDVTMPMTGLWDVFDIVPQEYIRLSLAAADTKRGIVWVNQKLIPRRVNLDVEETEHGRVPRVTIQVEKDSYGPAGVDGDYPDEVPDTPTNPTYPPEPTRPPGDYVGDAGPVVASHSESGVYWSDFMGQSWVARNTGLPDTDVLDLIWDPWWFVKVGNRDPQNVILWACGPGFIARSPNAGLSWQDWTPTTDPPNTWEDTTPPTASTVTYKQLHGDMYHENTFYALVEWQEPATDKWRGWVAKTENDGISWTWYALGYVASPPAWTFDTDMEGWEEWKEGPNPWQYAKFTDQDGSPSPGSIETYGHFHWDYNYSVGPKKQGLGHTIGGGTTLTYRYRLVSKTVVEGGGWHALTVRVTTDVGQRTQIIELQGVSPGGWINKTFNLGAYNGEIIQEIRFENNVGHDVRCIIRLDTIQLNNLAGAGDVRPLAMDLDLENGSRLWLTVWRGNNTLYLQRRNAANMGMLLQKSFGTATEGEVANKTYFIVPRAPFVLGGSGFGNYVWIYGRWNDGGLKHLAYSNDGGATITNKSCASWDVNHRIGALSVLYDNTTITAFVNHAATPRLWKSVNQGVDWTDHNSMPFNIEFDAATRCTWAADEVFIGRNGAGAQMAAWILSPWDGSWTDGTGDPGLPTESGAITSIIWVG